MNIPARRHPQSSLKRRGQVRNDVAKHVVGYDYVELPRVADNLHAQSIYEHMLGSDLRILFSHFLEYALPQATRMSHRIGFVAHQYLLSLSAVVFRVALAIFEGISNDALDTLAGVDVLLNRNLVRGTAL